MARKRKPVTKMVPIERGDANLPPHLIELERSGLIRIGTGKIKKSFWMLPHPVDPNCSARKALLKDRKESR